MKCERELSATYELNCRTQVLNGQERLSSPPADEMDEWHCVDFEVAFFRQGICAVFPSSGRHKNKCPTG